MVSLKEVFNSLNIFVRILEGPENLLVFRVLISFWMSSLVVGSKKNASRFGCGGKYVNSDCELTNFFSFALATVVKWMLNSLAMSLMSVTFCYSLVHKLSL